MKYYIIAAVIISLFISLLSSFLNLRSRLSHGLPARAHQRVRFASPIHCRLGKVLINLGQFLFRRTVRAHAQKEGSAPQQDGPQGAYNMTGVAPMPVNDPAGYPAYSGHTNGGEKLDSVQESTKRVAEADALPEYEAPLGPPPPAVTR